MRNLLEALVPTKKCGWLKINTLGSLEPNRSLTLLIFDILVSIQTRDGLHVRRGNMDYVSLLELVKKLEGLCWQ